MFDVQIFQSYRALQNVVNALPDLVFSSDAFHEEALPSLTPFATIWVVQW